MGELLRFATAGSVDDGKSTLIGRLLYDAKAIFEDQLDAVEASSQSMGADHTNLALLTDGLRAEREQGITIDVAYRYFATPKRKFIIADTPGHLQYTRNMVTGASTADLALVLVDARKGLVEQSRRHAFLASLLRIPNLVLCVNKMDLVNWSQERFGEIKSEFEHFASRLDIDEVTFVPVSALHGDNIVNRSANMSWYQGSSLLDHLEDVDVAAEQNRGEVRLPVQYVIRPHSADFHDYRGYAGTVAGGVLHTGDEIVVLPSGLTSTVKSLETMDGPLQHAVAGQSVTVRLNDEIDISRGDLICRADGPAQVGQDIEAMVCWLSEARALSPRDKLVIKHTTRTARAVIKDLRYRLDINELTQDREATSLRLNEIGWVSLRSTTPLNFDEYRHNRRTGSFVLVDETTNATVGAGMIINAES